ncbi:sodium pump decarboxylases, gamma subunit [Geosporobacter subterraneus DSM 17957]|uniref:Sodium pump decarboxylases, gamma subunit n=1 Tax=Geosporobacter subterraneus DSM 17957 TaxID=1121919 RepID=A0A1M6FD74_9FIRM|nr:OadG family protein [Geosporobacter subterraneus]SHI95704.1 sodium pump decarboxylases, gamma subunit [Geosporobacter subterraneus DSM 17957]
MFGETISLGEGLIVTALGMSVTFVALIVLSLMLDLLRILFYKEPQKAPVQIVQQPVAEAEAEEDNMEELVAVITAAVAASLQTSTHNIIVQNILRVGDTTPTWGRAGRVEQMNSRF